jgi:hypothetical protein
MDVFYILQNVKAVGVPGWEGVPHKEAQCHGRQGREGESEMWCEGCGDVLRTGSERESTLEQRVSGPRTSHLVE